jgi:hypothetical protein
MMRLHHGQSVKKTTVSKLKVLVFAKTSEPPVVSPTFVAATDEHEATAAIPTTERGGAPSTVRALPVSTIRVGISKGGVRFIDCGEGIGGLRV